MIEINTNEGGLTISDSPYRYERLEYEVLLDHLHTLSREDGPFELIATGKHLERICEHFQNIPKPVGIPAYGFVWIGDDARTLIYNINRALQHGITVVVETVDDYNFDWHNQ